MERQIKVKSHLQTHEQRQPRHHHHGRTGVSRDGREGLRSKFVETQRGGGVSSVSGRNTSTCHGIPYRYIYMIFFFFFRSGVFFVSASVWDARNWNFSVKSLRSSAVFGGRLQRPSPCLIRSALRRGRGWMLSETSEKRAKKCILNGISSYSSDLNVHVYGEVDNIKLGKTLFSNWRLSLSQNK